MEERNLKELFCSQCSLQFGGKSVYNLHLYLVHNVKDDGQKSQSKSENVEDIGENINGKQSFNCEICKRKFSFRFSLQRHISEVHEEKRPHKKVNMNDHKESVHEGKKEFHCGKCNYVSSEKRNMNKHIASVHEGKKPFQCEICDYRCAKKVNMNQHFALVHQD